MMASLYMRCLVASFFAWLAIPVYAQVDLEINTTSPPFITVCGPSAGFSFTLKNNTSTSIQNLVISYEFPNGIEYVPGTIMGTGITEADLSNLQQPVFNLSQLNGNGLLTFQLQGQAYCGVLGNSGGNVNTVEVVAQGLVFTVSTNPYNSNKPATALTNSTNLVYQGSVGDVFTRSLTIQNTGFGPLTELTVLSIIDPANLAILDVLQGNYQVSNDTLLVMFGASDFQLLGDGDSFLEQGEPLVLDMILEVLSCEDEVGALELGWGCGGEICEVFQTQGQVTVLTDLPTVDWTLESVQRPGFCSPGSFTVAFANTSTGGVTGAATAFDLLLELGLSPVFGTNNTDPLRDTCIQFTSFSINGFPLSLTTAGLTGFGLDLAQLTTDPDGPGGLEDLDNDGQFDDLALGASFELEVEIAINDQCFATDCVPMSIENKVFRMKSRFANQCDAPFLDNATSSAIQYQLANPLISDNLPSFFEGEQPFDYVATFARSQFGFQEACANDSVVVTIILPPTLEPIPGFSPLLNGVTPDFLIVGDTLRLFGPGAFNITVELPFFTRCDSNFIPLPGLPCATLSPISIIRNVEQYIDYYCQDPGCDFETRLFCADSKDFFVSCEDGVIVPDEGVVARNFDAERISYGWTDETLSTPISATTPGVKLENAMPYDEIRLLVEASVFGPGTYDSVSLFLTYFTGDNPYLNYLRDTLFYQDAETNTLYTCPEVGLAQSLSQNGGHLMEFDLFNLLQPGQCLDGVSVTAGDSMWHAIYVEVAPTIPQVLTVIPALYAEYIFQQNGFPIGCNDEPAILSVIDPGFGTTPAVDTDSLACSPLRIRTNFFQGIASTRVEDIFPHEYRPFALMDSIVYTVPMELEYVPGSAAIAYQYREDNTELGPIQELMQAIPDPIITDDGVNQFLAFYDTGTFPVVDFLTAKTKNEIGFDLLPVCMSDETYEITARLYNNRYFYSPSNTTAQSRNVTFTYDYALGERTLTVVNPAFEGITDTAVWVVELCHAVPAELSDLIIPDNWLALDLPAGGGVEVLQVQDISVPGAPLVYPVLPYGTAGDVWAQVGALAPGACRVFEILAVFNTCSQATVGLSSNFSCGGYPLHPDSTQQTCQNTNLEETLSLFPRLADLQINLITSPGNNPPLCEPQLYELRLINTQTGNALDPIIDLTLPGTGTFYVSGSAELVIGGTAYPIPDPTLLPGTNDYFWDLATFGIPELSQGVAGLNQGLPSDLTIRFFLDTDCDYEVNSLFNYGASWRNACSSFDSTGTFFAPPLPIDPNLVDFNNYNLDLDANPLTQCSPGATYTLTIYNLGDNPTSAFEKVRLLVSPGLNYVPGSFQNIYNMNVGAEPVIQIDSLRQIEWDLPAGVAVLDSMVFQFELFTEDATLLDCPESSMEVEILKSAPIACASVPGGECDLFFLATEELFPISINAQTFPLTAISATGMPVGATQETIQFDYEILNTGPEAIEGLFFFQLFYDQNGNGLVDIADPLAGLDSMNLSNWAAGQSQALSSSFTVPVDWACGPFIVAATPGLNGCLCTGSSDLFTEIGLELIGAPDTTCQNQPLTLSNPGGSSYTYQWSPSTYLDDPQSATPIYEYTGTVPANFSLTETLLLTATRPGGCSDTDTVEVTTLFLQANLQQTTDYTGFSVSCAAAMDGGITTVLGGGAAPFVYDYGTGGQGSPDLTGLAAGTYSVLVTDDNGCQADDSITLSEPPALSNTFQLIDYNGFSVSCTGAMDGSVTSMPGGGVGGYTFNWSNNTGSNPNTNLGAGTYVLTLTDQNQCEFVDTISLTEPDSLVLAMTANPSICINTASGSFDLQASGGVAPYDYLGNSFDPFFTISDLSPGSYTIEISDANGCTSTAQDSILEQFSTFDLDITPNFCAGGDNGSICVIATSGFPPYTYLWEDNSTDSCRGNLAEGDYAVTVMDGNGCPYILNGSIGEPLPILLDFSVSQVRCFEGSDGLIIPSIEGGTAPYTFNWSNNGQDSIQSNLMAGDYSLTIVDANGCIVEGSTSVGQPPQLVLTVSTEEEVSCIDAFDGSLLAQTSGGTPPYNHTWSTGLTGTNLLAGIGVGTYLVTVVDANGCSLEAQASLLPPATPELFAATADLSCFEAGDGAIFVDAPVGPGYAYSLDGSNFQTSPEFLGLEAGVYPLFLQDEFQCVYEYEVEVFQPQRTELSIFPDTTIQLGQQIVLDYFSNNLVLAFNWSPEDIVSCVDCPNPVVAPNSTTTFELVVLTGVDCESTASLTVFVERPEEVYLPTIFSPDFDGVNDFFTVYGGPSVAQVLDFKIFDRWGELVYSNINFPPNNETLGWDGRFRGERAIAGVYTFYAELLFIDGRTSLIKGSVSLIR